MKATIRSGVCEECGKHYTGYGLHFCSRTCQLQNRNRLNNPARYASARRKRTAYNKAHKTHERLMLPAARKKALPAISKALSGRTLSDAHKQAIGHGVKAAGCTPPRNAHLVGPQHPNYIDGSAAKRKQKYLAPEYKAFVRACLVRDNFTCQRCGAASRAGRRVALQVHHIKSWAGHPDLRYEVTNGITLCKSCHYRTSHRRANSAST